MKAELSVDPEEIERFSRLAGEWWDEHGKFRPLHEMNPVRLAYIKENICTHFNRSAMAELPYQGLSLLDIGCGGGLVAEPLTRLGGTVTGVDASENNIRVASLHAEKMGLSIAYKATSAEALAEQDMRYDVVLALEIIEHVADVASFMQAVAKLIKPGGVLFVSTLNRTPKAFMMAIVGAEYVMRLLPRGTHQWNKFLKPAEIAAQFRAQGLLHAHTMGMAFNPFKNAWVLNANDVSVNYMMVAVKE